MNHKELHVHIAKRAATEHGETNLCCKKEEIAHLVVWQAQSRLTYSLNCIPKRTAVFDRHCNVLHDAQYAHMPTNQQHHFTTQIAYHLQGCRSFLECLTSATRVWTTGC
jgi:hypothetical protein